METQALEPSLARAELRTQAVLWDKISECSPRSIRKEQLLQRARAVERGREKGLRVTVETAVRPAQEVPVVRWGQRLHPVRVVRFLPEDLSAK